MLQVMLRGSRWAHVLLEIIWFEFCQEWIKADSVLFLRSSPLLCWSLSTGLAGSFFSLIYFPFTFQDVCHVSLLQPLLIHKPQGEVVDCDKVTTGKQDLGKISQAGEVETSGFFVLGGVLLG